MEDSPERMKPFNRKDEGFKQMSNEVRELRTHKADLRSKRDLPKDSAVGEKAVSKGCWGYRCLVCSPALELSLDPTSDSMNVDLNKR